MKQFCGLYTMSCYKNKGPMADWATAESEVIEDVYFLLFGDYDAI